MNDGALRQRNNEIPRPRFTVAGHYFPLIRYGREKPDSLPLRPTQIEESLVFLARISETTVRLDFIRDKSVVVSAKRRRTVRKSPPIRRLSLRLFGERVCIN